MIRTTQGFFDYLQVNDVLEVTRIQWSNVSSIPLGEQVIRQFSDQLNWWNLSLFQKLSEEIIRDFRDRVNWTLISSHQKLSEVFIREFCDFVDWEEISNKQILSESFIEERKKRSTGMKFRLLNNCLTLS